MRNSGPGLWIVLVWAFLAAGCASSGSDEGEAEVNEDARPVVVISDVDLASSPGADVSPLPRYAVTSDAVIAIDRANGAAPVIAARVLSSEQITELRAALAAAGLTTRPVRDEPAGTGRGVEFAVETDDTTTIVTRRRASELTREQAAIVTDLDEWSRSGEALRVPVVGVVAIPTAGATADGPTWPAPNSPLVDGECAEVRGAQGRAVLDAVPASAWGDDGFATTSFTQDGTGFEVRLRPLVLAEQPCPRLAP